MTPMRLGAGLLFLLLCGGAGLVHAQEPQTVTAGAEGIGVPKKKRHVQPEYPQEALAQGIRGIVILEILIDTEGRVSSVEVIRSIAGLDEAAIAAVQQWEYEVTKVDGRPVNVRLTVPITFALKLPEMSRQSGIPELRQGVTPPWPGDAGNGGRAAADVTLDPDGRVGVARILEGDEPWSSSLIQALRTWRFATPPDGTVISFRVEADFVPGTESSRRVSLRLTGLRESQSLASEPGTTEEATDVAQLEPVPTGEAGHETAAEPAAAPSAAEAGADENEAAPEGAATAEEGEDEQETTGIAEEPAGGEEGPGAPEGEAEGPAVARNAPPPAPPAGEETTPAAASPSPAPAGVEPARQVEAAAPAASDPTAPPPIEVITAAPPPPPPENGISALQGVTLEPGVPDLTRGRRPVAPPFARMAGTSGSVEVDFSVGPGGTTVVGDVRGPDLLQTAARAAVETWSFRRTRADRLYLVAVFTYDGDAASATVRPQQP